MYQLSAYYLSCMHTTTTTVASPLFACAGASERYVPAVSLLPVTHAGRPAHGLPGANTLHNHCLLDDRAEANTRGLLFKLVCIAGAKVQQPDHTSRCSSSRHTTLGPRHHGSSATTNPLGPRQHSSSATATTLVPRQHGSSATATTLGPRHHGSSATATTLGPRQHGSSATATTLGPRQHGSTATATTVGPRQHGNCATATTAKPRQHGNCATATPTHMIISWVGFSLVKSEF